jgi:hypothetical protein
VVGWVVCLLASDDMGHVSRAWLACLRLLACTAVLVPAWYLVLVPPEVPAGAIGT